ncbi:MAG: mandelate racemase/muconate lactonizing enzyme family protein [Nitrososphaerota archaeon]|nr:mandelate racemase/muconate lactonizing enzyme family protein [Nitrososphaerota archaeon]MDG6931350.1 mandelate racemase/muconate lactonizing enzyme family protein [Nitrososphaerota archaeon]
MKIKNIEVIATSYVKPEPKLMRSFALVRVVADNGEFGFGEASDSYGHSHPALVKFMVENYIKKILVNEEVIPVQRLIQKIDRYTQMYFGTDAVITQVLSGIEIALWDLAGKSLEKPVYQLLGGSDREIGLYGTGCTNFGASYDWHVKFFDPIKKAGVNAFKVRIGKEPAWDVGLVRHARESFGDSAMLMVDAYMSYSLETALRVAQKISPYDVYFMEEPLLPYDVEGYSYLTARSSVPVAAGEHIYRLSGFSLLVKHGGLRIIQPDATICGGLGESTRISSMAEIYNGSVIPHIGGLSAIGVAANLHLATSIKNCSMMEFDADPYQPMKDEILVDPVFEFDSIKGGTIRAKGGPGLGIEIREDALSKYPYREGELYPDIYPQLGSGNV